MTMQESQWVESKFVGGMELLLKIVDMTKIYPPHLEALVDVNLVIHTGEIVALLGANGAGKSTLAKILTGAEMPTRGHIYWRGKEVHITSTRAATELGIAIVFQELNLLPDLTAAENVAIGLRNMHPFLLFSRKKAEALYNEMASLVPSPPKPDIKVKWMSVAERQKVAVIRALVHNPKLLIIDEGTSSWNLGERYEFQQVLQRLAKQKKLSIIYITHFIDDALRVTSRAVVLRDGRKVLETGPDSNYAYDDIVTALSGTEQRTNVEGFVTVAGKPRPNGKPVLKVENLMIGGVGPVSFTVNEGECVGFYGYPGCGAVEVLEAIAGLKPYKGSVIWRGEQLRGGVYKRLRKNVIFCTGDRGRQLITRWPVYLNVGLPRFFRNRPFVPVKHRMFEHIASYVIQKFRIKGYPRTNIGALSGGNQQKVVVGSGIEIGRPLLLLGDDITRGIDVIARSEIHQLLRQMLEDEVAVILWSTDPNEMVEVCDRVYIFAQGRVIIELPRDEITAERLEYVARTRSLKQGVLKNGDRDS